MLKNNKEYFFVFLVLIIGEFFSHQSIHKSLMNTGFGPQQLKLDSIKHFVHLFIVWFAFTTFIGLTQRRQL